MDKREKFAYELAALMARYDASITFEENWIGAGSQIVINLGDNESPLVINDLIHDDTVIKSSNIIHSI